MSAKDIGFKDLKKLGPGWCLKYTDIPISVGKEDKGNMWSCYLDTHSPHNGCCVEGVDWFLANTPEDVLDNAIQRRRQIEKEKNRQAA